MKLLSKRSFFSAFNERDQFYKSLIVKNTLQSSHCFLTRQHPDILESYQDIVYKDLAWGSGQREVINKLGSPRYKVEKLNDINDHVILFFKRDILNEKAILQCHFLANQLYFIHIDFLSSLFSEVSFIHDLLLKKYILSDAKPMQTSCIKDCFQNKIIISNDVTLSVSYVSGTPSIVKMLEKQLHHKLNWQNEKLSRSLSEL